MEAEAFVKNRWRGFKYMLVGMAIAIFGFAIVWFLEHWTGRLLFVVGFGAGLVGIVIHARQVIREFRADPKDLYPRAKQPWEQ